MQGEFGHLHIYVDVAIHNPEAKVVAGVELRLFPVVGEECLGSILAFTETQR